ncbi:hypothetical protein POJ06DRAFT_250827 [Lipomyces tetrasporus]|uniref:tRNA (uracil-O(2)-)-methyltransferase n=1 Tax=Lipomyces tetrasporus TaxID=54092 RepID=A0AAD7VT94_9ASCO|nr:uncharacterized protein POJ06DRAFT_250827 [Lipomyces tetrasporus]KAJ8101228.1 hypothetical protein POJ06DRAFT_250827 [Lipomyces tetrasporus]
MISQTWDPVPFTINAPITDTTDRLWRPVLQQNGCVFKPVEHFEVAMLNLIFHPNINSTSIMRADILYDSDVASRGDVAYHYEDVAAKEKEIIGELERLGIFSPWSNQVGCVRIKRRIVREIIPRNQDKDCSMRQSCLILLNDASSSILFLPHGIESPESTPYYHPAVSGILLHYISMPLCNDCAGSDTKTLQLYYRLFSPSKESVTLPNRLQRTALRLLGTAHKHSLGVMNGYQKRVHHDVVVDKVSFQDTYVALKRKYARDLVARWVESTDPTKHVFEDLAIAAFLIEFWEARYNDGNTAKDSISFVDIGCGNGVLVYILIMEGYDGYGIDARRRKTWDIFPDHIQQCLREEVLVPYLCIDAEMQVGDNRVRLHDGRFPHGSFLIGNHSDELTPWIPLLGQPFIVIPCCSHALSGAKYRYPTSIDLGTTRSNLQKLSTYAALVEHVAKTAHDVGWAVEREMLRIPSTRNAAIIGSERRSGDDGGRIWTAKDIIRRDGGAAGYSDRVIALTSKNPRFH